MLFFAAHPHASIHAGRPVGIADGDEPVVSGLFLVRRRPFAPLALAIQAVSLTTAVASVLTLGRAFGLVAADRGIKTGCPFRIVRHPALRV